MGGGGGLNEEGHEDYMFVQALLSGDQVESIMILLKQCCVILRTQVTTRETRGSLSGWWVISRHLCMPDV